MRRAGARTAAGRRRPGNDDRVHVDAERGIFVVSDGMGGLPGAGAAADAVIGSLPARLAGTGSGPGGDGAWMHAVGSALRTLSDDVAAAGRRAAAPAGATVVLALVRDGRVLVAHLGDSRAYLLRDGRLLPLTHDHTVVADLVRRGVIPAADADLHPDRSLLTRYVGMADAEPAVAVHPLLDGDRLLLCSDGLTRAVPDDVLAAVWSATSTPAAQAVERTCRGLVDAVDAAGRDDDVTVLVLGPRMPDPDAAPMEPAGPIHHDDGLSAGGGA